MADKNKIKHEELGDIEVLCDLHHIYLKPICKVHITVQISGLSSIGTQGRCLSTWELSEKLRQLCPLLLSPPIQMKVTGATVDFVRFVVELNSKADVKRVIRAVDSQVCLHYCVVIEYSDFFNLWYFLWSQDFVIFFIEIFKLLANKT